MTDWVNLLGQGHGCRDGTPTKARGVSNFARSPRLVGAQGSSGPVENQSQNEHSFGIVFATCLLSGHVYLKFCIYKMDMENHKILVTVYKAVGCVNLCRK